MAKNPLFTDIDYKESTGGADSFNRLYITQRKEVVHLGIDPNQLRAQDGGTHLTPEQVHELLSNKPDNLVILDARNDYEWKIGRFQNAITPDIKNFREFPEYIEKNLDQFKDKQVLMYCTGGIRCERATAYLKTKEVAQEVYQIEGGIHRYTEQYPDGYFRGKNYVFDNRVAVRINDDVLSTCSLCPAPSDDYANCMNAECNNHYLCCADCLQTYDNTCSATCQDLIVRNLVKVRPAVKGLAARSCCLV
jgi:predicted sulfurtransferase